MSIQSETLTKAFMRNDPEFSERSTGIIDKFESNKILLDGKNPLS